MSQTITNCERCGKPKPLTTQQQTRAAEWPTRVADIQFMLRKLGFGHLVTNEPISVNGLRLGVPDPPEWVEEKEQAPPAVPFPQPVLRTHAATQQPSEPFMFIPPPPWVETDKQEGPTMFR